MDYLSSYNFVDENFNTETRNEVLFLSSNTAEIVHQGTAKLN